MNHWRRQLGASKQLIVLYFVIAILLLLIGSLPAVIDTLTEGQISNADIGTVLKQRLEQFSGHLDDYGAGRLIVALFWAGLGGMVYILFWLTLNVIISLQNRYVFKTQYTHLPLLNHQHPGAQWLRRGLRAGSLLALLAFTYLFTALLYPLALELINPLLHAEITTGSWLRGTLALASLVVCLHLFTLTLRLVWLRSRLFV